HGITPDHTYGASGRSRGLRRHSGTQKHTVLPVKRLVDQRDKIGATATKQDRRDRHPLRVFPCRRDRWTLVRRGGEARVRMRHLGNTLGCPGLALPIYRLERRWTIQ